MEEPRRVLRRFRRPRAEREESEVVMVRRTRSTHERHVPAGARDLREAEDVAIERDSLVHIGDEQDGVGEGGLHGEGQGWLGD